MTVTKRQNFNITPEQEAEIAQLKELIGVATTKDAILAAVRVFGLVARELKEGRQVLIRDEPSGQLSRLIMPELEAVKPPKYKYLVERPHRWKRQLFVKGRRLPAATVWSDMLTNQMTPNEAAADWHLPLQAVHECICYSEENQALIEMEAEEESRMLTERGIEVDSAPAA